MAEDLEERLRSHARAFEGLMSLIPADRYYEKDTSDQWRKKKQTPEERRAAKRAKLDPANQKTVKDVLDENERKRKREREAEGEAETNADSASDYGAEGREKPREGMKQQKQKKQKVEESKQMPEPTTSKAEASTRKSSVAKVDDAASTESPLVNGQPNQDKAEKKREKEQRKKEKIARKEEKRKEKKAEKAAKTEKVVKTSNQQQAGSDDEEDIDNDNDEEDEASANPHADIDTFDASGMLDADTQSVSSSASSPVPDSVFSAQPSTSSTSSSIDAIAPASTIPATAATKPSSLGPLPKPDKAILQARLQAKIDALRAARKADGPDGRPARNRQELIDARRKKQETRKQHKKEMRKQAKEEELKQKAEEELARLRGSGSPMGSDIFSPALPRSPDPSFAFGRVTFDDGERLDAAGSSYFAPRQRGPSDAKTALQAAQNKASRLAGLDAEKRKDIEEKDMWLNAKKRAHGERVRDDVSLLKKTLKRKEKMKGRSEKEWTERIDGVAKSIQAKQKRREDNLQKRREEKGGGNKKKAGGAGAKKKRPGFEGGFRSKPKK